jgi:hypothetical protein
MEHDPSFIPNTLTAVFTGVAAAAAVFAAIFQWRQTVNLERTSGRPSPVFSLGKVEDRSGRKFTEFQVMGVGLNERIPLAPNRIHVTGMHLNSRWQKSRGILVNLNKPGGWRFVPFRSGSPIAIRGSSYATFILVTERRRIPNLFSGQNQSITVNYVWEDAMHQPRSIRAYF